MCGMEAWVGTGHTDTGVFRLALGKSKQSIYLQPYV